MPSYASSWGPRNLLGNRTQDLLRKILEDAAANRSAAPGSNAQKVGDYYAAPWTRWPSTGPASRR